MKPIQEENILLPIDLDYSWKRRLTPIVRTMSIWGLQLGSGKLNCWSILIIATVHLLLFYAISFTAYIMAQNGPFMIVIHQVIYTFSAIVVLISYYQLCFYRDKLDRCLVDVSHPSNSKYRVHQVQGRDHFRAFIFWFYCISYLVYSTWYFATHRNLYPYYKRYMFGLNPKLLHPVLAYSLAIISNLGYTMWLRAAEKLLCFFYSSVCRYISSEFKCLHRCIDDIAKTWPSEPDKERLLSCLNRYQDLCDIVSNVDLIFSSIVFLFIASLSLQITFDGNYMCKTKGFCTDPIYCLQYFIEFFVVLVSFIDVFMSGSSVTIEAQEIGDPVYRIASKLETAGKDQLRPRIGLWYWKIVTSPPKLSAFGSVEINRNAMVSILGIIVAYIIVMFELA